MIQPPTTRRLNWRWMLPLLLTVTVLGARGLNQKAIWYDEWWSIYYAGVSPLYGPITFAETAERVSSENNEFNPPGYYFVLNAWGKLAGTSIVTLRAWSLLAALLTLTFTYRIGRDLISWQAGLAAALILGFSAFFISYAHEMRGYMQLALLSAALLWSYTQLLNPSPRPVWINLIFGLSIVGLCYTHYMGFTVLAALGIHHLLFVRKNRRWLHIILVASVMGALFVPWLASAYQAFTSATTNANQNERALDALELTRSFLTIFSNNSLALVGLLLVVALPAKRLLWIWLLIASAITLIINQRFQFITDPRYLMALTPPLAVLGGAGLVRLQVGRWSVAALWSLLGVWLTLVPLPHAQGEWSLFLPWQQVRHELQKMAQPDDTFIYFLPPPVVNWFHARIAEYYLDDLSIDYHVVDSPDPRVKNDEAYYQEAETFVGDALRIWVARQPDDLPYPIVEKAFLQSVSVRGFADCGSFFNSSNLNLKLYVRPQPQSAITQFGDGITLHLLQPLTHISTNNLQVLLGWTIASDVPSNTYSVGLHITDGQNTLVRQLDYGLPTVDAPCLPSTIPLTDLPAGSYTLQAIVYAWQTGERLIPQSAASNESAITLGRFTVGLE